MDYNLVGVALPAGAKNVQLRFTDAAYEKGKLVTWLALALSLGALDRRMARRAAAHRAGTCHGLTS